MIVINKNVEQNKQEDGYKCFKLNYFTNLYKLFLKLAIYKKIIFLIIKILKFL